MFVMHPVNSLKCWWAQQFYDDKEQLKWSGVRKLKFFFFWGGDFTRKIQLSSVIYFISESMYWILMESLKNNISQLISILWIYCLFKFHSLLLCFLEWVWFFEHQILPENFFKLCLFNRLAYLQIVREICRNVSEKSWKCQRI